MRQEAVQEGVQHAELAATPSSAPRTCQICGEGGRVRESPVTFDVETVVASCDGNEASLLAATVHKRGAAGSVGFRLFCVKPKPT
jgi:hypothetical protein